jgi:Domain of unknown function (DUF4226)
VASYQDLLDAIARVRAATGDAEAWMAGLSAEDLAVVSTPVSVVAPDAIADVVAKIRARHRSAFDPPEAEGAAADAIRSAETSLAQQNSLSAHVDLQVITAVLNAHATNAAGRAALDDLQNEIESAVTTRTDLDTPAGARGFQRYLIDKLHDIRTVVETAGLDATSKASLAAALASLYAAATPPTPDPTAPEQRTEPTPDHPRPQSTEPAAAPAPPADVSTDPLLDQLLADDPGTTAADPPAPGPPMAAPMMPAVPSIPAMPSFGSTGLPTGTPSGTGLLPPPSLGSTPDLGTATDPFNPADDPLSADPPDSVADTERAGEDPEADETDHTAEEEPAVVHLPDGDTVTAPSPELAAAITAAIAGTPVTEAYRQQGITIPAAGTAVSHPVDPTRLVAGDIGMLTDRHAVALGNGKAVFNGKIEPISSVTGPSFLGWEHPPEPDSITPPTKSERPTPTRPAVTAGPSR